MKHLFNLLLFSIVIFTFTNCDQTFSEFKPEPVKGDLVVNMEYVGSEIINDQNPIYVWTGNSLTTVDLSNGFSTVQTTCTKTLKDIIFTETLIGFVDLNGDKKISIGEPYNIISVQKPGTVNLKIYDSSWFTFGIKNIQATNIDDPYNLDGVIRILVFTEKNGINFKPFVESKSFGTNAGFSPDQGTAGVTIMGLKGGVYDIQCNIDFNGNDEKNPDVVNGISDKYIIFEDVVINGDDTLEVDYNDFNFAQ